ncbi:hypothetical protein M3Y97_00172200 [Aphelenchoides bicaudatus]|nr:hypothetical protein M3Y97_00172200 [Aphelenchoides bicaudatus]
MGKVRSPRRVLHKSKDEMLLNISHKKTNVDSSMFEDKKKSSELCPGMLTGDKLIVPSAYSWRGVPHVEMDRVLAAGPTIDPVIHRGLQNFETEFC